MFVSRETLITASGQTTEDSFDLSEALTTPGPYNNTIGDSIDVPAGGTTSAQASQQSDLQILADSISGSASGSAAAQVAEFDAIAASADSQYVVMFNVTSVAETIHLSGSVTSTFDSAARVILDDNGSNTFFSQVVDFGEEGTLNFNQAFSLEPWTYRLIAGGSVTGTPTPNSANFNVSFNFDSAAVIPLPPAVYVGGAMLALSLLKPIRRAMCRA